MPSITKRPWCLKDIPGYEFGTSHKIDKLLISAAHWRLMSRISFTVFLLSITFLMASLVMK